MSIKKRDPEYDRKILSEADYQTLQSYKQDWHNATTDEGRRQANANAEALRASYGYSMGTDGASFRLLEGGNGVSDRVNVGLLGLQKGPESYQPQLDALLQQMQTRQPFTYDPATDPVYQSMQSMYQSQGRQAMDDTMAQTAALTGGYGSSYAQTAGQQAYQNSLQELADQIPQLYSLAQQSYRLEGENLRERADLLSSLQQQSLGAYNAQMDYWMGLAQQEQDAAQSDRELAWAKEKDRLDREQASRDAAAAAQRDAASAKTNAQKTAWQQAMDSIALGVVPSAAMLQAAGISTAWAYAMANAARFKLYQ